MKGSLALEPRDCGVLTPDTKKGVRFEKLSLDGVDPDVARNPVIRMLIQGGTVLSSGRRCSIIPEDEMLIFLD